MQYIPFTKSFTWTCMTLDKKKYSLWYGLFLWLLPPTWRTTHLPAHGPMKSWQLIQSSIVTVSVWSMMKILQFCKKKCEVLRAESRAKCIHVHRCKENQFFGLPFGQTVKLPYTCILAQKLSFSPVSPLKQISAGGAYSKFWRR